MTEQQPATTDDEPGQHRAPDQGLLERINLSEPVRLRMYLFTMAVMALLVGYGLLDNAHGALWLAVVAAALGITGTEMTRAAVASPTTTRRVALDAVRLADEDPTLSPLKAASTALRWNSVRMTDMDKQLAA